MKWKYPKMWRENFTEIERNLNLQVDKTKGCQEILLWILNTKRDVFAELSDNTDKKKSYGPSEMCSHLLEKKTGWLQNSLC